MSEVNRIDLDVIAELLKIVNAYRPEHQIEQSALTMMGSIASPVLRESVERLKTLLDALHEDAIGRKAHQPHGKG